MLQLGHPVPPPNLMFHFLKSSWRSLLLEERFLAFSRLAARLRWGAKALLGRPIAAINGGGTSNGKGREEKRKRRGGNEVGATHMTFYTMSIVLACLRVSRGRLPGPRWLSRQFSAVKRYNCRWNNFLKGMPSTAHSSCWCAGSPRGRLKTRDLTSRDHRNCGGWHRETGQSGTTSQGWTSRDLVHCASRSSLQVNFCCREYYMSCASVACV